MDKLAPLKLFLRTTSNSVHNVLFCRICTDLMRGQSISKKLKKLEGKVICLTISDTGNSWCFQFVEAGLKPVSHHTKIDVHIKGELKNLLLLVTHNEDPDTLFFNQELSLEGSTEDGLYLRNILDAMEFDTRAYIQNIFGASVADAIVPFIDRIQPGVRLQALSKLIR